MRDEDAGRTDPRGDMRFSGSGQGGAPGQMPNTTTVKTKAFHIEKHVGFKCVLLRLPRKGCRLATLCGVCPQVDQPRRNVQIATDGQPAVASLTRRCVWSGQARGRSPGDLPRVALHVEGRLGLAANETEVLRKETGGRFSTGIGGRAACDFSFTFMQGRAEAVGADIDQPLSLLLLPQISVRWYHLAISAHVGRAMAGVDPEVGEHAGVGPARARATISDILALLRASHHNRPLATLSSPVAWNARNPGCP